MSLTRYIQLKDTVPDMNLFARMVQLNTTWGNTATPHVIVSIYSILENFQIQMSSRGANSFPESLIQPPRGGVAGRAALGTRLLNTIILLFF